MVMETHLIQLLLEKTEETMSSGFSPLGLSTADRYIDLA